MQPNPNYPMHMGSPMNLNTMPMHPPMQPPMNHPMSPIMAFNPQGPMPYGAPPPGMHPPHPGNYVPGRVEHNYAVDQRGMAPHQAQMEVQIDPAKLFTSQEIPPTTNPSPIPLHSSATVPSATTTTTPATPERSTLRTSTSSTKKDKQELGTAISSKQFEYTRFTQPRKMLEVVPITLFPKPESNAYKCGNIISVNAKFMCYVVKGNSVRVIEIMTAARQLLKAHESPIVDMKFFSDSEDVLATLDKDGRLVVWNLESHATGATNEITASRQLEHSFSAAGPFVALAWDPSNKENLALVGQGALWLCNIPLCMSMANAQDGVLKLPVPEGDDQVTHSRMIVQYNDLSFSHDGKYIAAAGSNGAVVVWSMASREVVKVWHPHEGSAVYAAKFLAPEKSLAPGVEKLFLTGNKLNEELKLWHTDSWELLQTIRLHVKSEQDASHGYGNKLCFDKTCSFLFVTHTHAPCLNILHLQPPVPLTSGDQIVDYDMTHARFDYLTEYSLDSKNNELNPIMSFTVTNHKPQDHHHPHQQGSALTAQSSEEHGEVMHLQVYATQLRSIQMYHLNSSRCYVPQERVVSAPVSVTISAQSSTHERAVDVVTENNTNQRAASPPTVTELPPVSRTEQDKTHVTAPIMYVPHESAVSKPVEEEPAVPASPPHTAEKSEEEVTEPQESDVTQDMFEIDEPDEIETSPLPVEQKLLAAPIGTGDVTAASKKTPSKGNKQKVQFAPGTKEKDSSTKVSKTRVKKDKASVEGPVTILKKEDEPVPYVYEEVNTPESELIKRVKESGNGDLLQAIEEIIKFQNQQLFKRLDEERKQRERAEQERQKVLLNNISHALNQNLPKLLEKALNKQFKTLTASMNKVVGQLIETNLLKQLQEALKKLFFQNFVPRIETSVKEAIDKHLASKQIVQHVSDAVEKGVRQPILETFRSQFSEVLAPSFELALQKLFEQINNTFESGIREYQATLQVSLSDMKPLSLPSTANNTNVSTRTSHTSDASVVTTELLRVAVNSLVAVAENMNRVIVETQSKILNEYVERNGVSSARMNNNNVSSTVTDADAAMNVTSSKLSAASGAAKKKVAATSSNKELKVELEKSLKNELYEDAFTKALRANDLEIVAWLCSRVAPQKIFGKSPLPLSQVVLISLVQQLSCDLNKATSMKLNWLKDILLVLDPMDQTISEHVTPILTTLAAALEELAPTCGDVANPCFNSYRLLVHIVNSHLGHSLKTPNE